MSNFENRIRTLEARNSAGDAQSLRLLMEICHRAGGTMPPHATLERELGRRIDPALAKRAARLLSDMEAFRAAAALATNGTEREALKRDQQANIALATNGTTRKTPLN